MNKSDFIDMVAEKAKLSRSAAARVVEAIFDTASGAISEAVHAGGSLQIRGFGKFTKKYRGASRRRHPTSGVVIEVPARATVTFRPGQRLRAHTTVPSKRRGAGKRAAGPLPARGAVPAHAKAATAELAAIRKLALDVWENPAHAEQFLTSPHAMLDGQTPEQAAATPAGADRVREILMRLEYSIPA